MTGESVHPSEAETAESEHDAVLRILNTTREDGERRLVVWHPARQVAFGRRDTTNDGYEETLRIAKGEGYATTVRNVGGRAVVHAGSTVAFALTVPVDGLRTGLRERYEDAVCRTRDALSSLGVEARCDEPEATFCPGEASLCTDEGKVAGIAQRVTRDASLVSGVVIVGGRDETARLLSLVYDELGMRFEPSSVGTVFKGSGDGKREIVAEALRNEFNAP